MADGKSLITAVIDYLPAGAIQTTHCCFFHIKWAWMPKRLPYQVGITQSISWLDVGYYVFLVSHYTGTQESWRNLSCGDCWGSAWIALQDKNRDYNMKQVWYITVCTGLYHYVILLSHNQYLVWIPITAFFKWCCQHITPQMYKQ